MSIEDQKEVLGLIYTILGIGGLLFIICLFWRKPKTKQKTHSAESPTNTKKYNPENFDSVFEGFVGNNNSVSVVRNLLAAHQISKEKLPNLAIFGRRSTGKTELVRRISRAFRGPTIHLDKTTLVPKLFFEIVKERAAEPCIMFIDEVHAVSRKIQDALLTALESNDGTLTMFGETIDVSKITFIVATTDPGKLSDAFLSRFIVVRLSEYSEEEVFQMLKHKSADLPESDLRKIVKLSKEVPRVAISGLEYIQKVGRFSELSTEKLVMQFFQCNKDGYTKQDLKYKEVIMEHGPIGLSAISSVMGVDKDTIKNVIEPPLVRRGDVIFTTKGRQWNIQKKA